MHRKKRIEQVFLTGALVAFSLCVSTLPGCASLAGSGWEGRWIKGFAAAEARQRRDGGDLIILYKSYSGKASSVVEEAVSAEEVATMTEGMVRCTLVAEYGPDRAYVAQFGVERAPAVIVVRTDGTYHAKVGVMARGDVVELLNSASSPGQQPRHDPYIHRPSSYRWRYSFSSAQAQAGRSDLPMLIFYHNWPDSNSMAMDRELNRPEVRRAFADYVHCNLHGLYPPNRKHMAAYDVDQGPALVIVRRDGSHQVLDGHRPTGRSVASEAMVRFARRAKQTEQRP